MVVATDPSDGRSVSAYLLFGYGLITAVAAFFAIAFALGAPEVPAIIRRLPVVGHRLMPLIAPRYDE
jgi:hypothetical protein